LRNFESILPSSSLQRARVPVRCRSVLVGQSPNVSHHDKKAGRAALARLSIKCDFDGAKFVDLLIYVPMISDLLTIGILWHAIQSFPGFLETVGYLFGMLAASFTLEAYWQSDME
jgi:hypothetical protein